MATAFLKENFEKKKFRLKLKLETYSGYLEAFQNCVAVGSEVNRQKVVYWHQRIMLVAHEDICELSEKMYDPDTEPSETPTLRDQMVKLMR